MRQEKFSVAMDTAFRQVIAACATVDVRKGNNTWITKDMITAYSHLHDMGYAHSVECWQDDALTGGLYGISLGGFFFGESMFSLQSNASKYALYTASQHLRTRAFALIDCQVMSHHLTTLGATLMPRDQFAAVLGTACEPPRQFTAWPGKPLAAHEIEALGGNAALQ